MGSRKVIKFGRSSFVISLPSSWVLENGISKGDEINVLEERGVLIVESKTKEKFVENKEIKIRIKNEKQLKAEIISAYINNYDLIVLVANDLIKYSNFIRLLVAGLMGLEVVEESEKKIVLQDFMDIKNIKIKDVLRRLDRTLCSMMDDSLKFMEGKNTYELVFHKEEDLNKLTFFMFKVLKKALRPQNRKILKLKPQEVLRLWELILFMERIGDKIKRCVRFSKELNQNKELIPFMELVYSKYVRVMKAYFSNNTELALISTLDKEDTIQMALELKERLDPKEYVSVIDKILAINGYSRSIANCILRFETE